MATRAPRPPSTLAAFVLHRYDWSESSLILDLFTREHGRLAVAAKGAKRPYSQLRSVLLPFQRISVLLGRAPGADAEVEVRNLRAAEWAGGSAMLTGAALFSGFYLNELLMKLLARHDPHAALFDAYAETLAGLVDVVDVRVEAALRAFELTLLKETGVLPDLSLVTSTQQGVAAAGRYSLRPESGIDDAIDGTGLSGATLISLQAALDHGSLAALQQACTSVLPELKGLLRTQLHYHLGSSVLRTRQVMVEAQGLER
jgi:DNA repair protein RecO (recombination protein O)